MYLCERNMMQQSRSRENRDNKQERQQDWEPQRVPVLPRFARSHLGAHSTGLQRGGHAAQRALHALPERLVCALHLAGLGVHDHVLGVHLHKDEALQPG